LAVERYSPKWTIDVVVAVAGIEAFMSILHI
jgi:hypothetical protein